MLRRPLLRLLPLAALLGCSVTPKPPMEQIAADQKAMPPNTIGFSQMMRELSAQPGFTEKLLAQINHGEKAGAYLTPRLFDEFRKLILGNDWSGLDRFPGWNIRRITRTVDLGTHLAKGSQASQDLAVNVGPYALDAARTEDLDTPSSLDGFKGDQSSLGADVMHGDGPDPRLAPMHAESARLAQVLNRLSMNNPPKPVFTAKIGGQNATSPEQLVAALTATGHTVTVADARYFANFGHFHYKGRDVEMPFWLDTQLLIPTDHWWQRSRDLLVPVAHAEYEWIISGPKINADVTFYFGIDGRAEFRTNDEQNQPWVMGRHAHEYRGDQAVEVTRLTGKYVRAYATLHAAHPELPFGGYYTLGVCQDVIGSIELRMTGNTTLFPNTAKIEYFRDQPDAEITALMEAVPKDTAGPAPTPERVFGSLPTEDYAALTVPGLREDVLRVHEAWEQGTLRSAWPMRRRLLSLVGLVLATGVVAWVARRRRNDKVA